MTIVNADSHHLATTPLRVQILAQQYDVYFFDTSLFMGSRTKAESSVGGVVISEAPNQVK